MWTNFELVSVEDETLNSAFCTNGLFRISSDEQVSCIINKTLFFLCNSGNCNAHGFFRFKQILV